MTRPNISPSLADINDVPDALRLGGWVVMNIISAAAGAATVVFGRDPLAPEARGERRFTDAQNEEAARRFLGSLSIRR